MVDKKGGIKLSQTLPAIKDLSSISFNDYVQIKRQLEKDHQLPTEVVAQHDKDTVTFREAYEEIQDTIIESQHYADQVSAYNADLYSALITFLASKHLVNDNEINQISKIAHQLWENDLKQLNKDSEDQD